jgi:hypothetical protein
VYSLGDTAQVVRDHMGTGVHGWAGWPKGVTNAYSLLLVSFAELIE